LAIFIPSASKRCPGFGLGCRINEGFPSPICALLRKGSVLQVPRHRRFGTLPGPINPRLSRALTAPCAPNLDALWVGSLYVAASSGLPFDGLSTLCFLISSYHE